MFNVLGTNWGPTDSVTLMQIQSVKILLLRGNDRGDKCKYTNHVAYEESQS